jgi:hypothetical protein
VPVFATYKEESIPAFADKSPDRVPPVRRRYRASAVAVEIESSLGVKKFGL